MKKKMKTFIALFAKGMNYSNVVISNGGAVYIPGALL